MITCACMVQIELCLHVGLNVQGMNLDHNIIVPSQSIKVIYGPAECGSFCRLVHLSRNTPPPLVKEAFAMFDEQRCFSECTAVGCFCLHLAAGTIELKEGGIGLRRLSCHSPAARIASFQSSGLSLLSGKYLSSSVFLYNSRVDPQDFLTLESVQNSHLSQKVLSSKLEDQQFNNLFQSATLTDRARLLAISSPHASA